MDERIKKIFCIITAIIIITGLLPPKIVYAPPIAVPVGGIDVAQGLLDLIGAIVGISGDTPSASNRSCFCPTRDEICCIRDLGMPWCITPPRHMQAHPTGHRRWCSITNRWVDIVPAGPPEYAGQSSHLWNALQEAESIGNSINAAGENVVIRHPNTNLPSFPLRVGIDQLEGFLDGMAQELMTGYEMRWCFFTQAYRPFPIGSGNAHADNPFIEGICSTTGLPVLRAEEIIFRGGTATGEIKRSQEETIDALKETLPREVNINGNIYTTINGLLHLDILKNGQFYRRVNHNPMENYFSNCLGGFAIFNDDLNRVQYINLVTDIRTHSNPDFRYIRIWRDRIIDLDEEVLVLPGVQGNPLTLQEMNWLQDRELIMQLIRELGIAPGSATDELVMAVPLIIPEMFPEIAAEDFPQFAANLIAQLVLEQLVVPWQELDALGINTKDIPKINTVVRPGVLPHPLDYTNQINTVIGELKRQTWELERIRAQVGDLSNVITANPFEIDMDIEIDGLEIDSSFTFDFLPLFDEVPNLMEYFPFSLPFDMYNTFRVVTGQMPVQTVGMTHRETVAYMAILEGNIYGENDEIMMYPLHSMGMDSIQPMFLTTTAPKFEIEMPAPFNYTFVFDMGAYPQLIGVIRWSILIMFVFGLYKMTPALIKW